MDVDKVLSEALRAIDEAKIPPELRSVAFEKAVDLISGNGRQHGTANGASQTSSQQRESTVTTSAGNAVDRIAARLKLDPEVVGEVFAELDGDLAIIVSPRKLIEGKSGGTKQLALLLAAGRQAAGLEEFTPTKLVRDVAEDFKKFDSPNFASTLGSMSNEFNFHGTGQSRSVKLSRGGWEDAANLVRRLGGGEP